MSEYFESDFEPEEIIKLLDKLIGRTEAVGEMNADEKIHQNLIALIDVTNWCLDVIYQSSKTAGIREYSMNKIGSCAKAALVDYKNWLEKVTE